MAKAPPTLTVGIEGSQADGGAVPVDAFGDFLHAVSRCLRRVTSRLGDAPRLRHTLTDLRASSAYATMAARGGTQTTRAARLTYDLFSETVDAIEHGKKVDPRFTNGDLKEFRKLAAPLEKGAASIQLGSARITRNYVANLDTLLGRLVRSIGTVKGQIRKLNEDGKLEFTMYPPIDGYRVVCTYPEKLRKKVIRAFDDKVAVTVTGEVFSADDAPYPERVKATEIEVHKSDADLPTLAQIRNTMPDFTAGKTLPGFLDSIRDD